LKFTATTPLVVHTVVQRSQRSHILRESHAFHLQLTLSRIAACFSPNQAAFLLLL